MWGTAPLSAASVSDFPRSRTQWVNSTKGWTVNTGTLEGMQGGSMLVTNDDGAQVTIQLDLALATALDLGIVTDTNHPNNIKLKVKTSGADAAWTARLYTSTAGFATDFNSWGLAKANDIDETLSWDASPDGDWNQGAPDKANINYIRLEFTQVATAGEKVRVWLDELYGETDAGKVYFENGAATAAYKITVGAATTKFVDKGSTWTWDDTAGAGYDGASTGALIFAGTAASPIVMTSAGAPPANYWAMSAGMNLTADYTTWRYHGGIAIGTGTWDIVNCTSDHAAAGAYSFTMAAGCTITWFINVTVSNCVYGISCAKAHTAFDNIVITASGTQVNAVDVKLEFVNSNFDAALCNCGVDGTIFSQDHNDVNGNFVSILAHGDTVAFSEIANEPTAGDVMYFYPEIGGTAATFNFDETGKTFGELRIASGVTFTLGFTSGGTTAINGSIFNAYILNFTGATQVTESAVGAAADIYVQFISNANCAITIAAGAKYILTGSAAYRVYVYEALRLAVAGDGIITDSGPVNGIGISGGTLQATYAHVFHMRTLLKASTLTLTDSEYWFTATGTEPVEQIQAGTWTITRSLISSYSDVLWSLKPTGTITMAHSFLDHCIPSIYSNNFYIRLIQMARKMSEVHRPRVEAESEFLGGAGEYSEVTDYKSSYIEAEFRLTHDDIALWDHALDHRILIAKLEELAEDQDEIFAFTWHRGYYAKASLSSLAVDQEAGQHFHGGSLLLRLTVKERPYN